jgi:hypothetical protein
VWLEPGPLACRFCIHQEEERSMEKAELATVRKTYKEVRPVRSKPV